MILTEVLLEEILGVDTLEVVSMNFDGDGIWDYEETMKALRYLLPRCKTMLELDLYNQESPLATPFIEKPPVVELKDLPSHLRYSFLGSNNYLLLIIIEDLNDEQVNSLIAMFK